jgi:hypothetical protein
MIMENIWNFDLKRGNGHNPKDGACLMDAVSWFEYGTLGDHPECTCDVIAAYCRDINDAMTDVGRQKLKIFIPRLIGTTDKAVRKDRVEYLVWQAIRVFAPFWLDKAGMKNEAEQLRNFTGDFTQAHILLKSIEKDAYASASAAAAASASAAASAYAATAYASAAAEWEPLMLAALDGVLKIGKQAEPLQAERVTRANETFHRVREMTP